MISMMTLTPISQDLPGLQEAELQYLTYLLGKMLTR